MEKQDTALFALYQRMIALRKKSQALRHGGCQVLYAEDNVVGICPRAESAACTGGNQPWRSCEVVYPRHRWLMPCNGNAKKGMGN
ncbi:hypothetical protein ACNKHR_05540 [Shigella flexneri]